MTRLPIEEDINVLAEFLELFENTFESVEQLAIHLESSSDDGTAIEKLHFLLSELYKASIASNIAPLVEPLEVLTTTFDKFATAGTLFPDFSQALLLLMDRFNVMAREVADHQGVHGPVGLGDGWAAP